MIILLEEFYLNMSVFVLMNKNYIGVIYMYIVDFM